MRNATFTHAQTHQAIFRIKYEYLFPINFFHSFPSWPASECWHWLPLSVAAPRPTAPSNETGLKSKFTASNNLILAQEVSYTKAHISRHGKTMARYTRMAEHCSTNPNFLPAIFWKSAQGSFNRILEEFNVLKGKGTVLSGKRRRNWGADSIIGGYAAGEERSRGGKYDCHWGDEKKREEKMKARREIIIRELQNKKKINSPKISMSAKIPQKIFQRAVRPDASDEMMALSEMMKGSDSKNFDIERKTIPCVTACTLFDPKVKVCERSSR